MGWIYEWCYFFTSILNIVVKSRFSKCKTVTKKEIFCHLFVSLNGSQNVVLEKGLLAMEQKLSYYGNMRMIHLAHLFIYLFTLTPSADVQGPWLPSILPILNCHPEAANKCILQVNSRNTRKKCEICSKLLK